ncbi:MAG: pirin family protein [Bacteroidia bacterium]
MTSPIKKILPLGFPWQTQDPFLFCVHHHDIYPPANDQMGPNVPLNDRPLGNDFQKKDGFRMYHGTKVPGFPGHPHRGFETVTVVERGFIDHSDSMKAAGRFGEGDVQWMTAGSGVQHSEMFPLFDKENNNELELFQIWLNLPAKSKMVAPHFKMLWHENIPIINEKDSQGNSIDIKVIAGNYNNNTALDPAPNSWAASDYNQVAIWKITLAPNAKWTLPKASDNVNRSLYFFKGNNVSVAGTNLDYFKAIELFADNEVELNNGSETTELLLLQGKPISEKVVQYGPFVMNSEQEIQEAYADFQRTQWGGWPWPSAENVHDKSKGRFALHGNGQLELP